MLISLLTDFGTKDGYVGIMKGVIAGIAPHCHVIDLSHDIPPQDIEKAAFVLWSAIDAFPPQSIHVVVVDPGVGSERQALLVRAGEHFFVAPDNGVLWPALSLFSSWKAVCLEQTNYFRIPLSHTFHGRDLFSPVAAHLASGVPFEAFGSPVDSLQTLHLFDTEVASTFAKGKIIDFDHFGNAITSISGDCLPKEKELILSFEGLELPLVRTFSDVPEGLPVAFIDSFGLLEVAVRNGSAQQFFSLERGREAKVEWH